MHFRKADKKPAAQTMKKKKKKTTREKKMFVSRPNTAETYIRRMYGLFLFCYLVSLTTNQASITKQMSNSMLRGLG